MKKKIKVGIPKTLFYYCNSTLYRNFFKYLGVDIVISPSGSDEIIDLSKIFCNNNFCLINKIYVGEVFSLVNKCDYLFIPNYLNFGKNNNVCSKCSEVYNFIKNTFINVKILSFNVDHVNLKYEICGFIKIGLKLNKNIIKVIYAYIKAKIKQREINLNLIKNQEALTFNNNKKILVVGYQYVLQEEYIINKLNTCFKENNISVFYPYLINKKISKSYYKDITNYLDNSYNKEMIGAISYFKNVIDGIIFITLDNCDIDKVLKRFVYNKIKDIPNIIIKYPFDMENVDLFVKNIKNS